MILTPRNYLSYSMLYSHYCKEGKGRSRHSERPTEVETPRLLEIHVYVLISSRGSKVGEGQLNEKLDKLSKFASFSFSDTALNMGTDNYHENRSKFCKADKSSWHFYTKWMRLWKVFDTFWTLVSANESCSDDFYERHRCLHIIPPPTRMAIQ